MPPSIAWRSGIVAAALALALDQATKYAALYALSRGEAFPVTAFLNLCLSYNEGVSFGLFAESFAGQPMALATLTLVLTAFLAWLLSRSSSQGEAAAIGLIIGGALGNIVDRLRDGAVVDFLDFHVIGHHWPTFNLADVAIVIGTGLLCLVGALKANRL